MLQIAILVIATFLTVSYSVMNERRATEHIERLSGDVASVNFLSYRDAVLRYRTANPGATGTIADGVLTWQTGFIRDTRWTNLIQGGELYVYSTGAPPHNMADSLYRRTASTITVGVKQNNGNLSGPGGVLTAGLPG